MESLILLVNTQQELWSSSASNSLYVENLILLITYSEGTHFAVIYGELDLDSTYTAGILFAMIYGELDLATYSAVTHFALISEEPDFMSNLHCRTSCERSWCMCYQFKTTN